jgi:lysophospholipase L1-like esterase
MKKRLLLYLPLFFCGCNHAPQPPLKNYHYNVVQEQLDGVSHHNAFAALVYETDAPSVTVRAITTFREFLPAASVQVKVNGHFQQRLTFEKATAEQEFDVALPTGTKQVQLLEGQQVRIGEHGPLGFTTVLSVQAPKGYRLLPVAPKRKESGLYVFGDSRAQGGGYLKSSLYAWPVQLRAQLPATDVLVGGYCSMQLGAHIGTAAGRDSLTKEIQTALSPYNGQALWVEAGINDYAYATFTPAQLTAFYKQWLPQLHKALPNLVVHLQTDTPKKDEAPNKLGFTLAQYRQGEAAGGAGLNYVQIEDGLQLASLTDIPDGTHLSIEGDNKMIVKVKSAINSR